MTVLLHHLRLSSQSLLRGAAARSKASTWYAAAQLSSTRVRRFHGSGYSRQSDLFVDHTALAKPEQKDRTPRFEIPKHTLQKVITPQDAVSLIRNGDTVTVGGFVCQGTPEAMLRALAERYDETGMPNKLTIVFGGGPGDWDWRGLNHLAREKPKNEAVAANNSQPLLYRTIGSHYGQVPKVAALALAEKVEAWTMPMGSISRMLRAQSTHSPGHITTVGIGTYIDPDIAGGCVNESAKKSSLQVVSKINVDGYENLLYRALPIDVAIIRGTTGDAQGNITIEQESLNVDQRVMAAAARNSGGIVIAQVKRLAASGSLKSKDVVVPGALVDCVVVVDEKDHDELHGMSFVERYDPALSGQIRTPVDQLVKMPHDIRKLIARRAFFNLKPNTIVNLGIGLPEGVAAVAAEEGLLEYITLSTEPGVFGGQPCSGHNFGPAVNANAIIEMNEMFDFYDGGGLDICFLGAAQIAQNGDINVSRMSKDRLTGPGGFINISQSTKNIVFLSPLTAKGLEIKTSDDGTLSIVKEGKVKKFVKDVFEVTFSGDEAVRRGQQVLYVTERAVFRRTGNHPVLELIEVAPGVDLQKDVLDQLEFQPLISPNLKTMDPRIFMEKTMNAATEMFGTLESQCMYHEKDHVIYIDLFGINLATESDIDWFFGCLREILTPLCKKRGPIDMVANYDGFDVKKGLEMRYSEELKKLEKDFYRSVKRFSGDAFHRAKLGRELHISEWDPNELFDEFDKSGDGIIQLEELRQGMQDKFSIHLTPKQLDKFNKTAAGFDREKFVAAVKEYLNSTA